MSVFQHPSPLRARWFPGWLRWACLLVMLSPWLSRSPADTAPLRAAELGQLPWARSSTAPPSLPARPPSGPREMLDLLGIDESQLRSFFDGQPLGTEDEETLIRLLYRLPQFELHDLQRWEQHPTAWQPLVEQPEEHRAEVFRLQGRVQRVERKTVLPELVERFEFDHYYQVIFQLEGAPYPAVICTRTIPLAWAPGQPLDQRASASGLFLKVGDVAGAHPQLVFAAHRVAWHPDRVQPELTVTADQVLLGNLHMDVGLFDQVRDRHRKPIGAADRECFYQLLAAVGRSDTEHLSRRAAGQFALAPLLQDPAAQHGRLLTLTGTARRVTRIVVSDPDIRQRFGIDQYYQIDLFLPLGNQTIQLGKSSEGQAAPVYTNHYPATLCTLQLPPELEDLSTRLLAGTAETEMLNERITIPAFYFKLWAYRSEYVAAFDKRQLQLSPMFVGLEPQLVRNEPLANPYPGVAMGTAFLLVLAGIWFWVWRYSRSDRQFERVLRNRQHAAVNDRSLNDLGLQARDKPDFSELE